MPRMTAQEKRWQAESDARTLAEADTIRSDPTRLPSAKKAAEQIAKKTAQEAQSLKKVAGRASTVTKKATTKKTGRSR